MKKTVINLAIVSCFAFGISLAQASTAQASTHEKNGHKAAEAHASPSTDDGHAHDTSGNYFKKATIGGQTQNVQVDAKGVRLPHNMAEDLPSVGESDHGVRAVHGQANPYYVHLNEPKPKVESPHFWNMVGSNFPNGSTYNHFMSGYGKGYNPR